MPDSNTQAQPQTTQPQQPQKEPAPAAGAAGAEASPLSYKDMIVYAYQQSLMNARHILRCAQLLEESTRKIDELNGTVRDLKQQLAAMYLLSDEGKAVTSENVAAKIVESQTKALRDQLDTALKDGAIKQVDVVSKLTDIIWYSYGDGGVGYESIAALPKDQQEIAIGKKAGDLVGEKTIESIYELVEINTPSNATTENQDGKAVLDGSVQQTSTQEGSTAQPTSSQGAASPA
jgi:hypothetical protein